MSDDINTRCTAALRALEAAGVIESAWLRGQSTTFGDIVIKADAYLLGHGVVCYGDVQPEQGHDLSNPVTAASLIVLVREAWGDADMHCERLFTGEWVVIDGKGNAVRFPKAPTEVDACVAALEAKAQEVTP